MRTPDQMERADIIEWLEMRARANEAFDGRLTRQELLRIKVVWPKVLLAAAKLLREDGEKHAL